MPPPPDRPAARALAQEEGDALRVALAGAWRVARPRPSWKECLGGRRPARVLLALEGEGPWDSSALLFLLEARDWCRAAGADCDTSALPAGVRRQLDLVAAARSGGRAGRGRGLLAEVGLATRRVVAHGRQILVFVGDCVFAVAAAVRRPGKFRGRDCLAEMQNCGAMALPIVSLISILVGLTLAYQAAIQLRQFGADIYVADLVGLSVVREMGPMMTAVILAGRTGAAFAATLGNMRAGEEIDALQTLGISPVQFLVLPRLLALGVMTPLLVLYANGMGILGGMIVARGVLQIPPTAYWTEMLTSVDMADLNTGLVKAVAFGLLIGVSGCFSGLNAERSAAGVGRATTSAVVTSILLVVVADAAFAVIFHLLNV
jgi:phospholipid/cholesterol/gamma-HCH transport system permease protein